MIDYNLILYIGIALIVFGFILFITNEINKRKKEIKECKQQQQLNESFKKNKLIRQDKWWLNL